MDRELRLKVRVNPRSSQDRILGYKPETGELRISIRAAPVDDSANDAMLRLLSKSLGVPQRRLRIVRGVKSREKVVDVDADRSVLARLEAR